MASVKLGELLLKAKLIQSQQLDAALAEQRRWGGRLGEVLARMNAGLEDVIVRTLARQLDFPQVDLSAIKSVSPDVRKKVPANIALKLNAVPLNLKDNGKVLVVAMAEPQNLDQVDTLRAVSGCRISPHIAPRSAIAKAYRRLYAVPAGEGPDEPSVNVLVGDVQVEAIPATSNGLPPAVPAPPVLTPSPAPHEAPGGAAGAGPGAALPFPDVTDRIQLPQVVPSAVDEPTEAFNLFRVPDPPAAGTDALGLLQSVEQVQRLQLGALKAVVELMIEKGVFTREEYLAKVKR